MSHETVGIRMRFGI